jgi:hypothetical protein
MKPFLFLMTTLLTSKQLLAQGIFTDKNWYLEGRFFSGEIKKPDVLVQEILDKGDTRMFDLRVGHLEADSSAFAAAYHHPSFGIGFTAVDLSRARMYVFPYGKNSYTSERLGNIYALYGFLDQPLLRLNPFRLSCNFDIGVAYNTDIYNREENMKKIFSSTPLMIYVGFELGLQARIFSQWECSIHAGARHFSNGRMGIMNKGINIIGADISLRYSFSPEPDKFPPVSAPPFQRHFYYHVLVGGGVQTYLEDLAIYHNADHYRLYPKYIVTADALYRFSRIYAAGAGIDLFFVPSTASFKAWDEITYGEEATGLTYQPFSAGISINQELFYKNFSITASFGHYLYRELGRRKDESRIYERAGFRYYLPEVHDLFFGAAIKAHDFSKAEYFEVTCGKRF